MKNTLLTLAPLVACMACAAPEHGKAADSPRAAAAPPPGPPSAPVANEAGTTIIEAESMTLTACEAVPYPNGKAVKLVSDDAVGAIPLSLPPGEYLVNAYLSAPDGEHDALYLVLEGGNAQKVQRIFPQQHENKWAYSSKFLTFKIEGSGPHVLKFASNLEGQHPGESGMQIDRLEVVELGNSAKQLERWTNPKK